MASTGPRIAVCIPHWQVRDLITICLRSIRKHSSRYNLEVIVVDNGSHDASIDYLRSLPWIRLIERPEERPANWPGNVFTAWDVGIRSTNCEYFVTMHSDVFIKSDDWLDPFLREFKPDARVAAAGAWKLELENPVYALQKRVIGYAAARIKSIFGRRKNITWKQGHYPRDYCAMYRRSVIIDHGLTFKSVNGWPCGGYSIARQIWEAGYKTSTFPVRRMDRLLAHVAHGTAAVRSDKQLNHLRTQRKTERKFADLVTETWIQALAGDDSLDGIEAAA